MSSYSLFHQRLLFYGLAIWVGATVVLRFAGQHLLRPQTWEGTTILFVVSFLAMAGLARSLCRKCGLPVEQWPAGAVSLSLPTLLLDPFSSAFFPIVFPNMAAEIAGTFGGWMLCCCAGALAGSMIGRRSQV